jgi:SAM-dependent methyltransferase
MLAAPMRELDTTPEGRDARTDDHGDVDKWVGSRHVVQVRPHVWRWLAPRIGGGPVLEIGPGLRPTAPVRTSTFVDASAHALQQLEERGARTASAGPTLPFADASFDAALAFEVLEHVEEDRSLLDEIARVTRPGAVLVLSTPVHTALWSPLDDACGHVRRDEPSAFFEKVRAAGFEIGGYLWTSAGSRTLLKLRARALASNRQASTALVQRWVFPFHALYQRWFASLRWLDAEVPVPSHADDVMLWGRRTSPPRAA